MHIFVLGTVKNAITVVSQALKSSFSFILTPGVLKFFSNLGACFSKTPLKLQFTKIVLIGFRIFLIVLIGLDGMRTPGYAH